MSTEHKMFTTVPFGITCEEDPEEKRFDALVKLWVNDEISYSYLMKNYPNHDASMVHKILSYLAEGVH